MYILNEENKAVDLNLIPNECDMNFWVFDNSSNVKDYFCVPLVMLESFYSPTIRLKLTLDNSQQTIHHLNLPADYQILVGEPTHGMFEMNAITSLSGRFFKAFSLNPSSSFMIKYYHIEVDDVLPSIKWWVPKVKTGQIIAIPIDAQNKPDCIYIGRDIPKSLESINITDLF